MCIYHLLCSVSAVDELLFSLADPRAKFIGLLFQLLFINCLSSVDRNIELMNLLILDGILGILCMFFKILSPFSGIQHDGEVWVCLGILTA